MVIARGLAAVEPPTKLPNETQTEFDARLAEYYASLDPAEKTPPSGITYNEKSRKITKDVLNEIAYLIDEGNLTKSGDFIFDSVKIPFLTTYGNNKIMETIDRVMQDPDQTLAEKYNYLVNTYKDMITELPELGGDKQGVYSLLDTSVSDFNKISNYKPDTSTGTPFDDPGGGPTAPTGFVTGDIKIQEFLDNYFWGAGDSGGYKGRNIDAVPLSTPLDTIVSNKDIGLPPPPEKTPPKTDTPPAEIDPTDAAVAEYFKAFTKAMGIEQEKMDVMWQDYLTLRPEMLKSELSSYDLKTNYFDPLYRKSVREVEGMKDLGERYAGQVKADIGTELAQERAAMNRQLAAQGASSGMIARGLTGIDMGGAAQTGAAMNQARAAGRDEVFNKRASVLGLNPVASTPLGGISSVNQPTNALAYGQAGIAGSQLPFERSVTLAGIKQNATNAKNQYLTAMKGLDLQGTSIANAEKWNQRNYDLQTNPWMMGLNILGLGAGTAIGKAMG